MIQEYWFKKGQDHIWEKFQSTYIIPDFHTTLKVLFEVPGPTLPEAMWTMHSCRKESSVISREVCLWFHNNKISWKLSLDML